MKTRMGNVMLGAMVVILMTVGAGYTKADFTYPIDNPYVARTYLNGIDGDIIVGSNAFGTGFVYYISTGVWEGFALEKDGSFYGTTPYDIDDGHIVGHYAAGWRDYIGFLYNMATGTWITLDFAEETIAFDTSGDYVVGQYGTSGSYQGFVYRIGAGNWTTLNTPEGSTYLTGVDIDAGTGGIITASGRISGIYKSWLYDMGAKKWIPFDGPNDETQILLFGIDNNNIIGVLGPDQQPFLYDMVTDTWTYFEVPGAVGTYPQGIDGNRVVGHYDAGTPGHGFIYTFPTEATIDIDPDTVSLSSKDKWVTCYIELPAGYDVMDIDGSTVMLEGIPAYIGAEGWARAGANSGNIMDHDGDGILERMVKFDGAAVRDYLIGLGASEPTGLTVTGDLVDGPSFEGIDVIRVIK